ncbi:hypothetical protein REPUB_Repub01dG0039100 [Reevesia pubescens]
MGALCKVVDSILLLLFLLISVAVPLVDTQTLFPQSLYPDLLVLIYKWFEVEFQHFLLVEKPHFFVALVWLALIFLWPLALLNVYGMLASKPWFNTTCLIFAASFITTLVAILGEILGSPKATDKLLMFYFLLIGMGVLALLRGLVSQSGKAAPTIGKGPAQARKKSS